MTIHPSDSVTLGVARDPHSGPYVMALDDWIIDENGIWWHDGFSELESKREYSGPTARFNPKTDAEPIWCNYGRPYRLVKRENK